MAYKLTPRLIQNTQEMWDIVNKNGWEVVDHTPWHFLIQVPAKNGNTYMWNYFPQNKEIQYAGKFGHRPVSPQEFYIANSLEDAIIGDLERFQTEMVPGGFLA